MYSKSATSKTLESIELISKEEILVFFSQNNLDLINIQRVLKTKLNLQGFQNDFKPLKKIGEGSFAKAIKCSKR